MLNTEKLLFDLCAAHIDGAVSAAENYLSEYAEVSRTESGVIGVIKGKKGGSLLLDAHIDQIGFIVTAVDGGFLTVDKVGGIDDRILHALPVVIHSKKGDLKGVFCSTPPHLAEKDAKPEKIADIRIDTGLKNAADVIKAGDRISFDVKPEKLLGRRVTACSLDDRAGVAALILAAEKIAARGGADRDIIFLFSFEEEITGRGAKTAAFSTRPDEAVAVDVSFGDTPGVPEEKTSKLGGGAILGISPVLSQRVTDGIRRAAERGKFKLQTEVMGGATCTNADLISLSREGVPCGLLSIPLRNMHTPVETVDTDDVVCVADILAEYALEVR